MIVTEGPKHTTGDCHRRDDNGNNNAVLPQSFVKTLFVSWRLS